MKRNNTVFCYPNFSKKAITFTIDDGNYRLDKKFIEIVKPSGIRGTFNLVGNGNMSGLSDEEYRAFYDGFDIANHCKMHPSLYDAKVHGEVSALPFYHETSDTAKVYYTELPGIYHKFYRTWWGYVAEEDAYIRLIEAATEELELIFGKGNIKGFVWPYCEQNSDKIKEYIRSHFSSARKTGLSDFNLPKDRYSWVYNATHQNLLERADEYERLQTEELTFFAFGVHSHDFENNNCWDVLREFARKYGNRDNDYYYTTINEIFEYEDAIKLSYVNEDEIVNGSDIALYACIADKKIVIPPQSKMKI